MPFWFPRMDKKHHLKHYMKIVSKKYPMLPLTKSLFKEATILATNQYEDTHGLLNTRPHKVYVARFGQLYNCRLKPATLLKLTLLHGCFSRFLNCTNGTKSCNAPHMVQWMKFSVWEYSLMINIVMVTHIPLKKTKHKK